MHLRVIGDTALTVGHKVRLPGETFTVNDKLGRALLARHPEDLVATGTLEPAPGEEEAPEAATSAPEEDDVTTLDLSSRVVDALTENEIATVAQLRAVAEQGDDALQALSGIGAKALAEIKAALDEA